MRALLVLVAACAQPIVAVAPKIPTTSQEILARVAETYAKATSYSDRGEAVTTGVGSPKKIAFTTAFQRTGGFRYDYMKDGDAKRRLTIWSPDNRVAYAMWAARPGVEKLELPEALEGVLISSDAAAVGVPSMLGLGEKRALLLGYSEFDVKLDELDHHPVWHVLGLKTRQPVELWIDRESFLVRKIHAHSVVARENQSLVVDQTVTYEPVVNVPVAVAPLALAGLTIHSRMPALWIGVALAPKSMHVMQVFRDSPAAGAGIEIGDEILQVDSASVANLRGFQARVATHRAGDKVQIQIRRGGATREVGVAIAEKPDLAKLAVAELVGHQAPTFTLPTIDVASVDLAAQRGKIVVLDFWATWCGPCAAARPAIEAVAAKHADVVVIGISNEDAEVIRAYRDMDPITYVLARDGDSKTARDYLVDGIPRVVLIDKTGVVRFVGIGVDGAQALEAEIAKLAASP